MSSSMKRPAAASPGSSRAAKRPAKPEEKPRPPPAPEKLSLAVSKALEAATGFPAPVLEMLCLGLPDCLGVAKEKRHPFQEQIVAMMGDVLSSAEASLKAGVETAETKLNSLEKAKDEREATEKAAVDELSAKMEVSSAAVSTAGDASAACGTAQEALAVVEAAREEGQAALEEDERKKANLEMVLTNSYLPLKSGGVEPAKSKATVAAVMNMGQEFAFDPTLLNTLPSAVSKAPRDRGSFDNLVLEQVEAEFRRCATSLEAKITNAEPSKKEREAKVAEATAVLEKAKSFEQECKTAAEAAKAAQKEAQAAKQAASKALKDMAPELKQAATELERATAALDVFREGPLAAYKTLAERTDAPAKPTAKEEPTEEPMEGGEEAAPEPETAADA